MWRTLAGHDVYRSSTEGLGGATMLTRLNSLNMKNVEGKSCDGPRV
jgi:hypothetical protein